ncbi:hypothetical protein [Rhizohabitans arisaemae]|uniref:hypothetical protein n=1 Tax=Rhizohabitans arisaemae TaxID=2720610 RepID=UPI0024B08121|nr:hypothetical protein [Rhizohabitans arisaemae]
MATALATATTALVALLVARGVFRVGVWLPDGDRSLVDASLGRLMLISAIAALLATAFLHTLLVTASRPRRLFTGTVALITAVAALWPFGGGGPFAGQVAAAAVAFAVGATICGLLNVAAASSTRVRPPPPRPAKPFQS